jgi:hypothetical protein
MRRIIIGLLLTIIYACASGSKIPRPVVEPEISEDILKRNNLVTYQPAYKRHYFKILPYLYKNSNKTFNEIQGDFYNIDYQIVSNLNISPGYFRESGELKNILSVMIALSNTSTLPLNGVPISVESSKHGIFRKKELEDGEFNRKQQRVLFVKELELTHRYDVLNKVKGDTITVTIGGQIFEFLSPEIELK